MASRKEIDFKMQSDLELKFLEDESLEHIFYFPPDVENEKERVESNRLDKPIIMEYYLKHWRSLNAEKI
jgi:predicted membrane-bound spermidine synthase